MRQDAARNRRLIIEAARDLVSTAGPDVSMDAIARAAGVAVGTLYRHHPTKADLVRAVLEDSMQRWAQAAEQALDDVRSGADPGPRLETLFRDVAEGHATDQALKAASRSLGVPFDDPTGESPGTAGARVATAVAALLGLAADAGVVRADLTMQDVAALLAGTPDDDRLRPRYVEIVLAGIRAEPAQEASARPSAGASNDSTTSGPPARRNHSRP